MNDVRLEGCRTEPLGSYLKALGVLRLVAEQKDPDARGWWEGDTFLLRTVLGRDGLVSFLLGEYRPTPVVAPWNSGSGFRKKGKRPGKEKVLELIEASTTDRLAGYRAAIAASREVVEDGEIRGWRQEGEKKFWQDKAKPLLVELCRTRLPEPALEWLDASVVLAEEPEFAVPLLGTGGNLGSQELSVSFMERLIEVLQLQRRRRQQDLKSRQAWLGAALFTQSEAPGVDQPGGQFYPGYRPDKSSPLGEAGHVINPWDFVLLIEGSLLFASAAGRRLAAGARGKAAMPFMMNASAAGFATASATEKWQGEIWTPVWARPAGLREIRHLVGEGRSEWRRRQARSGVEMAKAVGSLGVDRGVIRFVRHAFLKRYGEDILAVPVGQVRVARRAQVSPLAQLDPWLDRVRRDERRKDRKPPAAVAAAIHRVDGAELELAHAGGPACLQEVLMAAAELEQRVGRATGFWKSNEIGPVPDLRAENWLPLLDDGSPELRLAAAMASQHDDEGSSLRMLLRPIVMGKKGLEWTEGSPQVAGVGLRGIGDVLAEAHARRVLVVAVARDKSRSSNEGETAPVGMQTAFRQRIPAPLSAVAGFVDGLLDEHRIQQLLLAFMLLDWRDQDGRVKGVVDRWHEAGKVLDRPPSPAWALLAPFFHGRPLRPEPDRAIGLLPMPSWPAMLARGQVRRVVAEAALRLRIARLDPPPFSPDMMTASAPTGSRIAAALLCPLRSADATWLLRTAVPAPVEAGRRSR